MEKFVWFALLWWSGTESATSPRCACTLKMLLHYLLACTVSKKKSAVILIFVPLYIHHVFFLQLLFWFFLYQWLVKFDYEVTWCDLFHFFVLRHFWSSILDLWVYTLHQIWKNIIHYFFKIVFLVSPFILFFQDSKYTYIQSFEVVLYFADDFVIFLKFFFFVFYFG